MAHCTGSHQQPHAQHDQRTIDQPLERRRKEEHKDATAYRGGH